MSEPPIFLCPECGGETGRVENWKAISPVLTHKNPATRKKCRASGLRAAVTTPNRSYDCPGCAQTVRVDRVTGRAQLHIDPRTYRFCATRDVPAEPTPLRLVGEKPAPGPVWTAEYTEKENPTWHASGGLPTLGKGGGGHR